MRIVKWFFLLLVMLWTGLSLHAQTASSAVVLGRVVDSSGAVVPDAQVTLRSTTTNATRVQKTNNVGQYVFSAVSPGAYTLNVTKNGFESATLPEMQVQVNQSYTVDVPLTVGAVTQAVEVTSGAVLELQTTDSTIGNVIGTQQLEQLPTQSLDASELLNLQPGAMARVARNSGDNFSTTGGAVSGALPDQNMILLDGVDVTAYASFGAAFAPVIPLNVYTVSEFRVGIANPNASFGSGGGAEEGVASRSGTNAIHGNAYWYNQNTAFNANDWDNNLVGLKNPHQDDNRVGVALGGPIQKDKTFWFFNYEGRRFSQAVREEQLVPSATLRQGIVTFPDASGNLVQYNLKNFDPRGIGISPAIQKQWSLEPQGNDPASGDGVNILGFFSTPTAVQSDKDASLKIDHQFSQSLHFFGRYQFYQDLNPGQLGQWDLLTAANGGSTTFVGQQPTYGNGATAGLDWIIRPTLINSLHLGAITYREGQFPEANPAIATQLALPGTNSADGPVALQVADFPNSNPYLLDEPINLTGGRAATSTNWQIRDDLNWNKGQHNFSFGADFSYIPATISSDNRIQGVNNQITAIVDGDQNLLNISNPADRPAGLPSAFQNDYDRLYASALGMLDSTQVAVARDANLKPLPVGTPFVERLRQSDYYFYAQDTWRLKPSLTLTYGLGYGWITPVSEKNGELMKLVDANGNLISGQSYLQTRQSDALNGVIYNPTLYHEPYGKAGLPGDWKTDWSNVAPRASLAWNPSASSGFLKRLLGEKNTVIRTGFGIVYDRTLFVTEGLTSTGFGQTYTNPMPACNSLGTGGVGCGGFAGTVLDPAAQVFRVGVDGPNIPVPPPDKQYSLPYAAGVGTIPPDFWDFETDPNYKNGRNYMVDFSLQREFSKNNIVEIGYVGRMGRRLQTDVSLNTPVYMFKDVTTVTGAPGSGQLFYQAYNAIANAVRAGVPAAAIPTQPWFEDQLPTTGPNAFIASQGPTCAGLTTNTQCIATVESSALLSGNLLGFFSGGIDPARAAANLPTFRNTQQADLLMHGSYALSNYNAMTVTWRNRSWAGLTFDLNYTFSKSLDDGSRIQVFGNGLDNAFNAYSDYGPSYFDRTHVFNGTFTYALPFGKSASGAANRVIGGWSMSGIFTAASGVPLLATESFAYGGGFITTNPVGEIPTVSSIPTGLHDVANGVNLFANPNEVFNDFRPIQLGVDQASGRANPFRGFGNWNLDYRLTKQFKITERIQSQFTADFFNVFNHPNFNDPGAGAAQGGLDLTSGPLNFGASTSSVIPADRIAGARWIQMGVLFTF